MIQRAITRETIRHRSPEPPPPRSSTRSRQGSPSRAGVARNQASRAAKKFRPGCQEPERQDVATFREGGVAKRFLTPPLP